MPQPDIMSTAPIAKQPQLDFACAMGTLLEFAAHGMRRMVWLSSGKLARWPYQPRSRSGPGRRTDSPAAARLLHLCRIARKRIPGRARDVPAIVAASESAQ